jgi:hypothetical protein
MIINGRQYEWADISLILGGRLVTGARGISYKESQEKELLYGKGNRPMSIQKGNKKYEGSVTLLQSEVETLKELGRSIVGRASILDLNLNAVVCYGDPSKGDVMLTDQLFNIQFTEVEKSMKQGDKNMEVTLPFICTDIKYGV